MVRTISNAFESGRIPQAWILTGVRGVGKTTTARILARALNYELPDGSIAGPTIDMPVLGVHCQAIMESRHLDVIEMDAASHNGVEDVRQINDAIRYAPVSARYKVYILDEVHMLSGAAFNALLKTLEEPPSHAKFVFATTEIRKVPITVLSRCQRFDLRRVDAALLVKHLQGIAAGKLITAEPEALALIARAAEGSVRDALSLFDQAIAHAGAGPPRPARYGPKTCRQMLGLADRASIIDLFEALMRADLPRALAELRDQYDTGADPAMVLATSPISPISSRGSKSSPRLPTTCRSRKPNARAAAPLRPSSRCACWRGPGRCCSRASRKSPPPAGRSPPPKWFWSASPTPPICRRRTRWSARSARRAATARDPCRRDSRRRGRNRAPRRTPKPSAARRAASGAREPPRGAPRAALAAVAPAELPANEPVARAEPANAARALQSFEELVALAAEKRDAEHQERARTRRAAGALRRRPARNRSRGKRAEKRSPAICRRSLPTGPAGAGW